MLLPIIAIFCRAANEGGVDNLCKILVRIDEMYQNLDDEWWYFSRYRYVTVVRAETLILFSYRVIFARTFFYFFYLFWCDFCEPGVFWSLVYVEICSW